MNKINKLIIIERAWTELTIKLSNFPVTFSNKYNEERQELYHKFLTIAYDLGYDIYVDNMISFEDVDDIISFEDIEELYEQIKFDLNKS